MWEKRSLIFPGSKSMPVQRQCALLGLQRSSYYYTSREEQGDTELMNEIMDIWIQYPFYGYRRITGFIARSLIRALKAIDSEIKGTELALKEVINSDPILQTNCALLKTIPGVGEPTALMFLSYLRELGQATSKEIAALSGLAPMNNESGAFKGKRRIKGGRHDVRTGLYMPILGAATQHNKRLKEIYTRLVAAGKLKKVALTACMRKLVIWANAILKSQKPWDEAMFARV